MYRIETHLHTAYISRCGWMSAQALIKSYAAAGYDAICVTDHYNRECFDYADIDLTQPGSKTDAFLLGFRRLQREAAGYGIRIYEGAELRFDGSENDYLLYGFSHDLLMTAGSDCHRPEDVGQSGILTDTLPEDGYGLAQLLRSGNYQLIKPN